MKLVAVVLLVALGVWAVVATTTAAVKWWNVSSAVDEVARAQVPKLTDGVKWPSPIPPIRLIRVKEAIIREAAQDGVTLADSRVDVSLDGRTLRIRVKWVYPVVTAMGENVVAIPLRVARSYDVPGADR